MAFTNTLAALTSTQAALKSTLQVSVDGQAVKVYDYDPGLVGDSLFVCMALPDLSFPDVRETQTQMGTYDVDFSWEVYIYVKADDLKYANVAAYKLMAEITDAIEANQTLDGNVEDIRVVTMNPSFVFPENAATKLLIECTLHGFLLIEQ